MRFAALVTLAVLLAGASSGAALSRPAPMIAAVVFGGSPAKPIVTVTGRNLSVPPANPAGSPSDQPLCPKTIRGNAGHDYGTSLYVTASHAGKVIYTAGRYRPTLHELDCIGIIVLSHTRDRLRFRFGAAYSQADFGYPHILNGDRVTVVVGGASFRLIVRFHR
jgi:hypothetical protein